MYSNTKIYVTTGKDPPALIDQNSEYSFFYYPVKKIWVRICNPTIFAINTLGVF